jgi:hypothetical protein
MAIAFDSNATGSTTGAASITFSHTVSGSDRVLFAAGEDNGSHNITCTYNGVSMTQIDVDNPSGLTMLYLIAPATGANNVVMSRSGSGFLVGMSASYTGADQTTPINAQAKEGYPADNAATESISITPGVVDCWAVGCAFANVNAATTAGAGTTIRQSNSNASGGVGLGDNNAAINPAASTTLNFVSTSSGRAAIIVALAPSAGGAVANGNFLAFM